MHAVWTVVLAAGTSGRFGASKMLAPCRGEPLVRLVTGAAQVATPNRVLVVTGRDAAAVAAACRDCADRVIFNPDFERGIGASIAHGVSALGLDVSGVIIALADQVRVDAGHFLNLLAAWSGDADAVVATRAGGRIGPPTLFGRDALPKLARLDADEGGRQVLQDPAFSVSELRFEAAARDIDTPSDLEAFLDEYS